MSDMMLSLLTFSPLFGVFVLLLMPNRDGANDVSVRWVTLLTTLAVFGLSLVVFSRFDWSVSGYQFVEEVSWLGGGIFYRMGIDGIAMPLILLTTFLMPIAILAGWSSVTRSVKAYHIAFLALEVVMIGVFTAKDLILFYLFFEAGLIPMFLIIGIWGGARRVYAAFKFFLYTLLGSLFMLLAIIFIYLKTGTTDIGVLLSTNFSETEQLWLWAAFFASFAVKMPMWPVHTWLPDAHVEAPTAGSVILAGVLLKMGGYGFIRFSLPMFPDASLFFAPLVFGLSVVAVVYTSLVALVQEDIKKLIAYSSVAHMGFVTMGLFSGTEAGVQGAMFQMISHGFISGALFFAVGVIYDRVHTREIAAYGGLVNRMPHYATLFLFFTMANVGLPGTSGFIGEFLTLLGTFEVSTWTVFLAATGVILSAGYALWLFARVVFGELNKPQLMDITDLNLREYLAIVPLALATLYFGIFPSVLFDLMGGSVGLVLERLASVPAEMLAERVSLLEFVRP